MGDGTFMKISRKQNVGEVKRGRCASRYLACAARQNARNLTVACMCRAPPSYSARACVWLDVAFDDAAHFLH